MVHPVLVLLQLTTPLLQEKAVVEHSIRSQALQFVMQPVEVQELRRAIPPVQLVIVAVPLHQMVVPVRWGLLHLPHQLQILVLEAVARVGHQVVIWLAETVRAEL